jgi:hypothetical protein
MRPEKPVAPKTRTIGNQSYQSASGLPITPPEVTIFRHFPGICSIFGCESSEGVVSILLQYPLKSDLHLGLQNRFRRGGPNALDSCRHIGGK